MKREMYVRICSIVVILALTIFVLYQSKDSNGGEDICRNMAEPQEIKKGKPEEAEREGKEQEGEGDSAEVEKILAEERAHEKIELMDYAELPIEEFIEKTGIPLRQDQDNGNLWETDDNIVGVRTDGSRIILIGMDKISADDGMKELIDTEGFPYTLAGVSLNDGMPYIEGTVLKDAVKEDGMLGEYFYGSLSLSRLGIEIIHLWRNGNADTVGGISAKIDSSLKENAEELEYIWEERVMQKEAGADGSLKASREPYTRFPRSYREAEDIDETFVWIKYPCLEIPGRPETEKNANDVIAEAVKKIEDSTYRKTDENIIVDVDYVISYESSKFISIVFIVRITDDSGIHFLWQYCNINIDENGRKAYLSDMGISRERLDGLCSAVQYPESAVRESYVKDSDTNWDQYYITLRQYRLLVPVSDGEEGSPKYGEAVDTVEISKWQR